MITNQIIVRNLETLREITRVDFSIYDAEGIKIYSSLAEEPIDKEMLNSFILSPAESQVVSGKHLIKIFDEEELVYILVSISNGDDAYNAGRIAAATLGELIVAYKEKYDRNSFYQNLLLDNMLLVDIYNRAKKLHIETEVDRVVYVITAKSGDDGIVKELLRGMYTSQAGDAVITVDEKSVVLVKQLSKKRDDDELKSIADTIVSLLNTEAMLPVTVSYGLPVKELKDVSKSYKEARMAMDVGKIFYAEKSVVPYSSLGIGRLIYQLPVNLCEIFIKEIFGDKIPDVLDEETRRMIDKFFENNLNVSQTSREIFLARNTLVYRLEKIQKATGLDLQKFDDAMTYKIAIMVESYLAYVEEQGAM